MENRVRDLEHIQEKDNDDRNRRFGILALAVLTVIGLTFAMGVVVGRAANPKEDAVKNPLVTLDKVANIEIKDSKKPKGLQPIKTEELTFPIALNDRDDTLDIKAAVEAAAEEEAELRGIALSETEPETEPQEKEEEVIPDILPASIGAGSVSKHLKKTAKYDPLVTAAIQAAPSETEAPRGKDGEFTIQVISYDRPEPARAFAKGLRARGHHAFVTSADVPERGRYYRVRIGPFESMWRARLYQQKFEEEERMSTFVVRRKEDT